MKLNVNHGIPASPYFMIVQPLRRYEEPLLYNPQKVIVELSDPKSKENINAELFSVWTFDEQTFEKANDFALLTYGVSASQLKNVLLDKYPELKKDFRVQYWLLKRLK